MPSFLFVFDFDETLTVRSSNTIVEELAPRREDLHLDDIDRRYTNVHHCWNRRLNELHERLAEQGIRTKQLIDAFRTIELSPGTDELFRAIHARNHKIIILSNACDLVVKECLCAHHLLALVERTESNPVRELEPIMIIDEYAKPLQSQCTMCEPNLCKGAVIDRYRRTKLYEKIVFVGDGDNDVCAALHLDEHDYAFVKYDQASERVYAMYDILQRECMPRLKANLCLWKTMRDVHDELKASEIL